MATEQRSREPEGLRIRVFGPFEVEGYEPTEVGSRKARTFLQVLALARGKPVSADALVASCWPEEPPAEPAGQLAVLASRLRRVLGRDRIVNTDAGYLLRADWVDLTLAERLADDATARLDHGRFAAAYAAADAALGLVRGPLLEGTEDAHWVELERAVADRLVTRLRQAAAEAALSVGEIRRAIELAEQELEHDPYDETCLRVLMRALVAAGRPAQALAAFERVRARLADELGTVPAAATTALHVAILRDEPVAGRASAAAGHPPPPQTELPGRAAELGLLLDALHNARQTGLQVLAVEGEAGIGKTALLHAFAARARERGSVVLEAVCDDPGHALPLQIVLDAVAMHLRRLDRPAAASLLHPRAALLGPLLDHASDAEASVAQVAAGLEEPTRKALLYGELVSVARRMAASGPVVMLLDDMHLADEATLAWLEHLRRRAEDLPLVVVAAGRPAGSMTRPQVGARVQLGPVDLEAAGAIVGTEQAAAVYRRSGGNPLFLIELARAHPQDDLPASIVQAVSGRVAHLGPAGRSLRTAALLGEQVDLDLLAAVTRQDPIVLLDHLEQGVQHGFLVVRAMTFAFKHQLIREALAAEVAAPRAALVHREAARALAGRGDHDPLSVAWHAQRGGDDELAARSLSRSAWLAVRRADYGAAEDLLDRSLALVDHDDVRLQRARVRTLRRRLDEAIADAETAFEHGAGAAALQAAGWAAYFKRDFETVQRLAADATRLAADERTRASCLALAGRITHAAGDLDMAEQRLTEAVELVRGPDLAVAATWLGTLRSHQSRTGEALDLLSAATRATKGSDHVVARLHALMFTGHAQALAGQVAPALASLSKFAEEVAALEVPRFTGFAQNFRGWVLRSMGAHAAADEFNTAAFESALLPEAKLAATLDLAEGALMRGDLTAAGDLLDAAEQLFGHTMVFGWRQRLKARSHRARLLLATGHAGEAIRMAAALASDAQRLNLPRYALPARLLVARARRAAGELVDHAAVEADIDALPSAIALESWWLTAEAARDLGVERWWHLAERRLAGVLDQAGEDAATFAPQAQKWLAALRTARR